MKWNEMKRNEMKWNEMKWNKIECISPKNKRQYAFLLFFQFTPEMFKLVLVPFVYLAQGSNGSYIYFFKNFLISRFLERWQRFRLDYQREIDINNGLNKIAIYRGEIWLHEFAYFRVQD